jgi:hypothetical protein
MPDLAPLLLGSLRPSDFPELDLSSRQLHVWTALTGFQPADRDGGKWRRFSPADVFRLSVMRELKGRTGLPITDHLPLVQSIGGEDFFRRSIKLWFSNETPCLITNLTNDHRVMPATEIIPSALLQASTLYCLLNLATSVRLMLIAVARGGAEVQRAVCDEIQNVRKASAANSPMGQIELKPGSARNLIRRDRGRALDPDEADVTSPTEGEP